MCGLVAVISKYRNGLTLEQADTFHNLLLVDTLRGEDSTGAFLVHNNGDLSLAKEASTGGEFLTKREWKDLRQSAIRNGAALIGHNRKATKGLVTDENAHPFVVEDKIVLVHNGGIWGDHKTHADVEVDSHAIAHLIHKHETPDEALSQFHGAYALMWYDFDAQKVHIVRNKERPLWFMETDNAWIWASERAFLVMTAMRQGLKIVHGPLELEENSLNTYELQGPGRWDLQHRKVRINRPVVEMKPATTPASNNNHRTAPWEHEQEGAWWDQIQMQFDERQSERDRAAAEDARKSYRTPDAALNKTFMCTVGGTDWLSTSDFERQMAKQANKMITAGEFNREVPGAYIFGTGVKCRGFEYVDDGKGGFYLYASPIDDQQIIFRHHFTDATRMTEQRIMHMALNEYLLELKVSKKGWSPFKMPTTGLQAVESNLATEGYCVIESHGCTILEGGGVRQPDKEKMNAC